MTFKEFFDLAERFGLALFPLRPGSKEPYAKFYWRHRSSKDRKQWEAWAQEFPGCNWAIDCLGSNLIGVDIDVTKVGRDRAWATFHRLCQEWGLPAPLSPFTQSARGGWHVLVRRPDNCPSLTQRDLAGCINTRVIGYLVCPPSFYDGTSKGEASGHYMLMPEASIHVAPAGLITALAAPLATEQTIRNETNLNVEAMRAWALWMRDAWQNGETPNDENPWTSEWAWKSLGMALKLAGLPFELWALITWSDLDLDEVRKDWNRFEATPKPGKRYVTLGTWFARSDALGCPVWVGKNIDWSKMGAPQAAASPIQISTAASLRMKEFAPIKWIAPGYAAEGLTILAGRPKSGKSWLTLDLALAVATGGEFLSKQCPQGDALVLALEDNERRLQDRIEKVLGPFSKMQAWPDALHYTTEWPRVDEGGLEKIREWIAAHPNARLIVVDVLARVKPVSNGKQNAYEADYRAIQGLQSIASECRVGIVVVHHTRKSVSEIGDAFDEISGTLGLAGAADAALVLRRSLKGVTLYGRGRDVPEVNEALEFLRVPRFKWRSLGPADEHQQSTERKAILAALKLAEKPMTKTEIANHVDGAPEAVRKMLSRMVEKGILIKKGDKYQTPPPDSVPPCPPCPDRDS